MKKFLYLFLITSLFAGNLEIEGGMTVTGEVQSPTIQALLDQIAQLQQEIALLQIQMQTSQSNNISEKIIEISLEESEWDGYQYAYTTNLNNLLPNEDVDWAIMNIIECNHDECRIENINSENGHVIVRREGSEYVISSMDEISLSTFVVTSNTYSI